MYHQLGKHSATAEASIDRSGHHLHIVWRGARQGGSPVLRRLRLPTHGAELTRGVQTGDGAVRRTGASSNVYICVEAGRTEAGIPFSTKGSSVSALGSSVSHRRASRTVWGDGGEPVPDRLDLIQEPLGVVELAAALGGLRSAQTVVLGQPQPHFYVVPVDL